MIRRERSGGLSRVAHLRVLSGALTLALALVLAGCGGGGQQQEGNSGGGDTGGSGGGGGEVSGKIAIEGSSTVIPITQAAAEAYSGENPDVQITVGGAGTGDGFEAFCSGNTQISDASRPIEADEMQACEEAGVEFIELPVALDGISIVTNPANDFAQDITMDQLATLWCPEAEGQVTAWNQVNPEWPDQPISLYGPGTQSGTFDFFTDEVCGEEGASRTDYQASEDDNVLVQGVSGDPNGLGYFGFSYYQQNQDALKLLTVDGVEPNVDTIGSGEYPLSRPLFIYVSTQALEENPAVEGFVNFYLEQGNLSEFVEQGGYINLEDGTKEAVRQRFEDRITGTIYEEGELPEGSNLEDAVRQDTGGAGGETMMETTSGGETT
jgi:phosphate transport system substrate-binding protein